MMKQLTSMLLPAVFVVVASSIAYAQPKPKMTADEQALIALDKQWTAAELRLNDDDRKTIDRIVADDYTDITPFGQIENKAHRHDAPRDGQREANLPQHPRVGEARQ